MSRGYWHWVRVGRLAGAVVLGEQTQWKVRQLGCWGFLSREVVWPDFSFTEVTLAAVWGKNMIGRRRVVVRSGGGCREDQGRGRMKAAERERRDQSGSFRVLPLPLLSAGPGVWSSVFPSVQWELFLNVCPTLGVLENWWTLALRGFPRSASASPKAEKNPHWKEFWFMV